MGGAFLGEDAQAQYVNLEQVIAKDELNYEDLVLDGSSTEL